ncbi:hypothetical protein NG701_05185 [Pseudarthrobacter sp. HLT3-5]|uniref:hypothetical protein n=1 Tax=Pseudarthrobacter cellobiosi TaxID=2953654 RepID=UPI00208E70A0|nr:hypothetical protein [Pseudarthrobacter sp. HLT3-5]MCO4273828.1 hypothetical protein [Pseudarthrobacter sp. HLT3-5]
MTHLTGIRAKIDRAKEHLLQLDDELHMYLDLDPIALVRQIQPDGETSVMAVQVTSQPPVSLSVLVGEIAHQLRSAVDHIACGLVLAAGNTPTRRTSFPVCKTRPIRLAVDGGVSSEALTRVDDVQPYQQSEPTAHPLYVLNELWNVDKHRNLHLTALMLKDTHAFLSSPNGSSLVGGQFQTGVVGDDCIIGAFGFANGEINPDLEITAMGLSFVALDESGPWPNDYPVQSLLENLYDYVSTDLVPKFEPLLAG